MTIEERLREQFAASGEALAAPPRRPVTEVAARAGRRRLRVWLGGAGVAVAAGLGAVVLWASLSPTPAPPTIDPAVPGTTAPTQLPTAPTSFPSTATALPTPGVLRAPTTAVEGELIWVTPTEVLRRVDGHDEVLAEVADGSSVWGAYSDGDGGAVFQTRHSSMFDARAVERVSANGERSVFSLAERGESVGLVGVAVWQERPTVFVTVRRGEDEDQVEDVQAVDLGTGEVRVALERTGEIEAGVVSVDARGDDLLVTWIGDGSNEEVRLHRGGEQEYEVLASGGGSRDLADAQFVDGDRVAWVSTTPWGMPDRTFGLTIHDLGTGRSATSGVGIDVDATFNYLSLSVRLDTALVSTVVGDDADSQEYTTLVSSLPPPGSDAGPSAFRRLAPPGIYRFALE